MIETEQKARAALDKEAVYRLILEGTVRETGAEFFRALVRNLASALDTLGAWVTEYDQQRQRLRAHQDLIVKRRDHSVFPAEATLSRFETRRQVFHTLILRNADERLEAERQIRLLTQEAEHLREVVRDTPGYGELLGRSNAMETVFDAVKRVAATNRDLKKCPQRENSGRTSFFA